MKKTTILASIAASMLLIGCGKGTSSSSGSGGSSTLSGTFVDAPVAGLYYETTSGLKGTTDSNGKFKYKIGDTVTFKLGSLSLGKGKAKAVITPYDLADNNATLAINIALILQNFDSNRNDKILDLTKLKDFNFTNINLKSSSSNLETAISNFLNNNSKYVDPSATLINSTIVKKNMDKDIAKAKLTLEKKFTVEYLNGKSFDILYDQPGTTKQRVIFDLTSPQQFLDENVNPPVTRTGYKIPTLDNNIIRIVDGKIYEYTYKTVNFQPKYNDGVNIYTIKSIDNKKITCDMNYGGGSIAVYFYFVP